MSKDTRSIPAAFRGYLLPRSAHDSLIHTRDQLRLLAQFTEARSESSEYIVTHPTRCPNSSSAPRPMWTMRCPSSCFTRLMLSLRDCSTHA